MLSFYKMSYIIIEQLRHGRKTLSIEFLQRDLQKYILLIMIYFQ